MTAATTMMTMRLMIAATTALALLVGFATAAGATVWWESKYDVAGSSLTVNIYDPALPPPGNPPAATFDPQPITGTLTIHWGAVSMSAPITQGKFMGGTTNGDQFLDAGLFVVTGESITDYLPPVYGHFGTIAGDTFSPGVIPDSAVTGFIHCQVGSCALGGFQASVPQPLTPTGTGPFPLELPDWSFTSGTAGVGTSWTAPPINQTIPASPPTTPFTNVLVTNFVGAEISRTFVPEPTTGALFVAGATTLSALARRRSRR